MPAAGSELRSLQLETPASDDRSLKLVSGRRSASSLRLLGVQDSRPPLLLCGSGSRSDDGVAGAAVLGFKVVSGGVSRNMFGTLQMLVSLLHSSRDTPSRERSTSPVVKRVLEKCAC